MRVRLSVRTLCHAASGKFSSDSPQLAPVDVSAANRPDVPALLTLAASVTTAMPQNAQDVEHLVRQAGANHVRTLLVLLQLLY